MIHYDFRLSSGDRNVGTVYLPDQDSLNLPVMIYCHGWGGSRKLHHFTRKLCERTIATNMAFVAFDFFGCGETGGDNGKMTYTRWKRNLSDIMAWIREQRFADISKIGCYAFSSGSTAAFRLAAEDDGIAFIISIGTCISAHIGMGNGGPAKLLADNLELLRSGGTVKILNTDFGIEFFSDTISNAPLFTLKNIKCPVLFLQGLSDNIFRITDAKMGYQIMKQENLPVTHIEIEGGAHGLENVGDEALQIAFDWINSIGVTQNEKSKQQNT
jgi:pimeloyl-ACP methyl ester carboxylesterase